MTRLDYYVFNALYRAYNQGWCDGHNDDIGDHGFLEVIEEQLFCPEYAELSSNSERMQISYNTKCSPSVPDNQSDDFKADTDQHDTKKEGESKCQEETHKISNH